MNLLDVSSFLITLDALKDLLQIALAYGYCKF